MERPGVMFLHDEHRGSITPGLALVTHGLRRLRGVPLGPIRLQRGPIVTLRGHVAPLFAAPHEGSLPQLRPCVSEMAPACRPKASGTGGNLGPPGPGSTPKGRTPKGR